MVGAWAAAFVCVQGVLYLPVLLVVEPKHIHSTLSLPDHIHPLPPLSSSSCRFVSIEKCSNCQIVLGPVEHMVTVTNCDEVTLVTFCRKLHIR